MRQWLFILLLLLVSGCRRVKVDKEFAHIKQKAKEQTHSEIQWHTADKAPACLTESLSRQRAIGVALENNMELQAIFEDLGIAKADLVQAGFFTNPHIDSLFKFPGSSTTQKAQVEILGSMNLSDFWQVPIKSSIACSDLEIMSFTILRLIMETTIQVKIAYDTCLYKQELLSITHTILLKVKELRERITYRQTFGYQSDLDRYFADSVVGKWETKVIQQKAELKVAYTHLRRLLGITVSSESLLLTNALTYEQMALPSINTLEQIGQKNRTTLQISQLKIQKAQHELSLQKARVMDNVTFGFTYERDFDRSKGWGPAIGFDLPLFDQKLAQISRAKFFINKTKKAYKAEMQRMQEEIYQAYAIAQALKDEIAVYQETIIPASKKGIDYSNRYFNRMQLNMIVLLETQLSLYEVQENRLNKQYHLALTIAELERSIGKILC